MPEAVYIHIPFCHRICPYCDFNKVVLKGKPVQKYLEALRKEMEKTVTLHPPNKIKSIFVGGGTPTTLNPAEMKYFIESIQQYFQPQEAGIEFTMEANPEKVDSELLYVMKSGGVNRLSFGVQTFEPDLLKKLGRTHREDDVYTSLKLAREAGFENLSIDLMFGLPNQTVDMFERTLDIAFGLDIPHFSAYGLKVEEGTFFHTLYEKEKLPLPPEEDETHMYDLLMERMEKQGYTQYEISNFARPGYQSTHNVTYWKNEEYYGLGAGAHGYVKGTRHVNAGPLNEYIERLEKDELPYVELHHVSKEEAMEEMMFMGLRMSNGISEQDFFNRYQVSLNDIFGQELATLLKKGLLSRDNGRYFLTKTGKFLGNEVFATFIKD
jgi:oxygen-independent coproporphyrinogen-3 oxidase